MRQFALATILYFAAVVSTSAAPLADHTQQSFMPGHGQQIEYLAADGTTWLWYPGNTKIVPGDWKVEQGDICFRYGRNTYNPVTRRRGGDWDCAPLKLYQQSIVKSVKGDLFGLMGRKKVPFDLPAKLLPLNQLQAIADPTIVERQQAKTPTCEQVLANANKSADAKLTAAGVYFHGKWLGKSCGPLDYVRAVTMTREVDEREAAAMLKKIEIMAADGNPRAISALKKLGYK